MIILEQKSKYLSVNLDTNQTKNLVKKLIKDYKILLSDYTIENNIFILYNKNQYIFTDFRNDLSYKGVPYEEI